MTPVLIVGGGLVGLSTAVFLSHQGIASVVVERLRCGSALPRAAHFHLRTLELFRLAGIEAEVQAQSEEEFSPEGAIVVMQSLAGTRSTDIIGNLNDGVQALSPCRRLFITQPGLEPILRRRAVLGGAQILSGHEVINIQQDSSGVSVFARDVATGAERTLQAQYLIAADGAHSRVRELLGIPFGGRGAFSNSMTIYFEADLAPYMRGKSVSVIYINNSDLGGVLRLDRGYQSGFLIVNTVAASTNAEAANAAVDVTEPRLVALVRSAAGVPNLPVNIVGITRWRATAEVAQRYREGRIFLAGDAAHVMPPNGGFGGNTGIHDAHNLAWKLALVLRGRADRQLLATYDAERRPVAILTVEQAYTRYVTRTATCLQAKGFQPLVPDFNIELGYLYRSHAIISEDNRSGVHDDPRRTLGRPGSRAPHIWLCLDDAKHISSLDLFGRSFVLLAGPQGEPWCSQATSFADLDSYRIGATLHDPKSAFATAYGLSPTGAVLIRPDGFVGWRAKALVEDPRGAIEHAMETICG
jgi:2-polyprenyl-6-methoxyphenol hydroxylase-like FAD-dependent oxidoreductase